MPVDSVFTIAPDTLLDVSRETVAAEPMWLQLVTLAAGIMLLVLIGRELWRALRLHAEGE